MDAVNISGKINDMDFMIHVLGNLPEEYEVAVESLEEKLEDTKNVLDIEDIRSKLNARFARLNKKREEKTEDEKAFATFQRKIRHAGTVASMDMINTNVHRSPRTELQTNLSKRFTLKTYAPIVENQGVELPNAGIDETRTDKKMKRIKGQI